MATVTWLQCTGVTCFSFSASITFITQPIGSLVSGFLQDMFGRKRCMLVVNIPQVVGWLVLYTATSVRSLYLAVVIMGLSVGFMEAPVLSYIGEITEPRLRGVLRYLTLFEFVTVHGSISENQIK